MTHVSEPSPQASENETSLDSRLLDEGSAAELSLKPEVPVETAEGDISPELQPATMEEMVNSEESPEPPSPSAPKKSKTPKLKKLPKAPRNPSIELLLLKRAFEEVLEQVRTKMLDRFCQLERALGQEEALDSAGKAKVLDALKPLKLKAAKGRVKDLIRICDQVKAVRKSLQNKKIEPDA